MHAVYSSSFHQHRHVTGTIIILNRIMSIYDELKPLTILDPLLLCGFIYICPKKELPGLFSKVHPFFSMSFLSKLVKDRKNANLEEVNHPLFCSLK